MNTFRIYEEFRESLGEPAARALAQTLGGMFEELRNTVTKEDFRTLDGQIRREVSRLDTALGELAQAQKRTEERVDDLAQAQKRTEERLDDLAQAQKRTEERLDQLALAQQKTELELHLLIKVVKRQSSRLDVVLGRSLELQFRDRMTSYLWRFLRNGRLVSLTELADRLEPALDEDALDELSRADAIATGLVAGRQAFVVAEVSSKADANDVRRVVRWAGLLEKAGLSAIPLVACDVISDRTLKLAGQEGVRVFKQGRILPGSAA
ncbi:MAG: hypothetical protein EBZ74_03325 [Planctomycetia bacterium]|nr:hypothetical protein [Planctomycetia bacterium]